ncbi:MAG: hypothetical protein FD138_300 [Planctomycetota bacterium]|nr:MAG: hypothetical protein FD138_300 [Planctomycetota bacterium]
MMKNCNNPPYKTVNRSGAAGGAFFVFQDFWPPPALP